MEDKYHGANNVGVFIMELIEGMMDLGSIVSLRMWPISGVHLKYALTYHLLVGAQRSRA